MARRCGGLCLLFHFLLLIGQVVEHLEDPKSTTSQAVHILVHIFLGVLPGLSWLLQREKHSRLFDFIESSLYVLYLAGTYIQYFVATPVLTGCDAFFCLSTLILLGCPRDSPFSFTQSVLLVFVGSLVILVFSLIRPPTTDLIRLWTMWIMFSVYFEHSLYVAQRNSRLKYYLNFASRNRVHHATPRPVKVRMDEPSADDAVHALVRSLHDLTSTHALGDELASLLSDMKVRLQGYVEANRGGGDGDGSNTTMAELNESQMHKSVRSWMIMQRTQTGSRQRGDRSIMRQSMLKKLQPRAFDSRAAGAGRGGGAAFSSLIGLIGRVTDWSFDSIRVAEACQGSSLFYVGSALFKQHSIELELCCSSLTLTNFLTAIEGGYDPKVPYHNSTHATEVLQAAAYFVQSTPLGYKLPLSETAAFFIAAAIHDFKHLGVTNSFLIATSHPLAILHSDSSVLERFHLAEAFQVMRQPQNNILSGLSRDRQAVLRSTIIDLVLATDLKFHFEKITELKELSSAGFDWDDPGHRACLLRIALKTADLSHAFRPWERHRRWTNRILDEFRAQVEQEKAAGLTESYVMLAESESEIPASQLSFLNFLVRPLVSEFTRFAEVPTFMLTLQANCAHWAQQVSSSPEAKPSPPPAARRTERDGRARSGTRETKGSEMEDAARAAVLLAEASSSGRHLAPGASNASAVVVSVKSVLPLHESNGPLSPGADVPAVHSVLVPARSPPIGPPQQGFTLATLPLDDEPAATAGAAVHPSMLPAELSPPTHFAHNYDFAERPPSTELPPLLPGRASRLSSLDSAAGRSLHSQVQQHPGRSSGAAEGGDAAGANGATDGFSAHPRSSTTSRSRSRQSRRRGAAGGDSFSSSDHASGPRVNRSAPTSNAGSSSAASMRYSFA